MLRLNKPRPVISRTLYGGKQGTSASRLLERMKITMAAVVSEWGLAGIETLRPQVSVFVIVDVLSFSTAVDVAVSRGAVVYPFPYGEIEAAQAAAAKVGAVLAQPRRAAGGQFSLSPASLTRIAEGTKLMLPSPNGSRLSLACDPVPVLTGCLRNAAAVAGLARNISNGGVIGVIPAGERWPDGSLRAAIEDLLGAGAVIGVTGRFVKNCTLRGSGEASRYFDLSRDWALEGPTPVLPQAGRLTS